MYRSIVFKGQMGATQVMGVLESETNREGK